MKKLLSLALAVLMLCTLFTVNTFAENVVIGGTGGVTVEDFTATDRDVTGTVSVKVTTVTHKYSVDITYSNMDYTLPSLTWDPSALKYVAGAGDFDDKVTITLTNYSDLPVYATASFKYADDYDEEQGFGFAFEGTHTNVKIDAATIEQASDPKTFTGGLTDCSDPDDISKAVNYYKGKGVDTITIGTYTVTISQDNA